MENQMPKYIALLNWTDQGMRGIKHTVERAKACRASLKAVGATLGDVYWTNGQYDVILSFDAPDGETAFKARLANAMLGNAHWTILRVFGEREMEKLIGELP
jgi:uncharacterized protein with GYD domain